jgi:large conductance mechanosensitive channel
MLEEFKRFAMRGNVVDLAVGLVLGTAFGAIVNSMVKDIIMPPIGMAMGGVNFADLFISLDGKTYPSLEAANLAGAPVIAYGMFINHIITFVVVALAMFLLVKQMNRMVKAEPVPETPAPDVVLLTEIRDLLRNRSDAPAL